jgi:isoleucyl-tRNA synthetase
MTAAVEGTIEVSRKGITMSENVSPKRIEQLLAEADELVQKINADALKDMQAEHLLQVEKHAQNLKKVKAKVQSNIEKEKTSGMGHSAEGMHEAFQEITKAVGQLKKYLSGDPPDAVK